MPPNVLAHIAATPIPRRAWKRAGLPMEAFSTRETLGDCTLGELYSLCTLETTTPEGLAFVTFAGRCVEYLEERVVGVDVRLAEATGVV